MLIKKIRNIFLLYLFFICSISCKYFAKNDKANYYYDFNKLGTIDYNYQRQLPNISSQEKIVLVSYLFGKPKPLHKYILNNWKESGIDFYLVMDNPSAWEQYTKNASNFHIKVIQLSEYFNLVKKVLEENRFELLLKSLHGRNNLSWYACSFRPMIPILFPEVQKYSFWGWIDWDVFISRSLTSYILDPKNSDIDIFLTPSNTKLENGAELHPIDQIKIFKMNINKPLPENLFIKYLSGGKIGIKPPLEYHFLLRLRNKNTLKNDDLSTKDFAMHMYNDMCGTLVAPVTYYQESQSFFVINKELLFFIADSEVKNFDTQDIKILDKKSKDEPILFNALDDVFTNEKCKRPKVW